MDFVLSLLGYYLPPSSKLSCRCSCGATSTRWNAGAFRPWLDPCGPLGQDVPRGELHDHVGERGTHAPGVLRRRECGARDLESRHRVEAVEVPPARAGERRNSMDFEQNIARINQNPQKLTLLNTIRYLEAFRTMHKNH